MTSTTLFRAVLCSVLLLCFVDAAKLDNVYKSQVALQAKIASGRHMKSLSTRISALSRSSVECPADLSFAFVCECYLNSLGRFPLPDLSVQTCEEAVDLDDDEGDDDDDDDDDDGDDDDDDGHNLAELCAAFVALPDPITKSDINNKEDEIFTNCPELAEELCPDDPDYNLRECQCYLIFEGEYDNIFNPGVCDPFDIASKSEAELDALEERCGVVERFNLFPGAIAGTTVRLCISGISDACCSALG